MEPDRVKDDRHWMAVVRAAAGGWSRRVAHRRAGTLPAGLIVAALVAIGLVALMVLFTVG